jgi:Ion transport protein
MTYGSLHGNDGSQPLLGDAGGGNDRDPNPCVGWAQSSGFRSSNSATKPSSTPPKAPTSAARRPSTYSARAAAAEATVAGQQPRPVLKTIVSKRSLRNKNNDAPVRTFSTTAAHPTTSEAVGTSGAAQKGNISNGRGGKSFIYTMLNPRSTARQAAAFKWFIATVIVMDLVVFVLSTEPNLSDGQRAVFGTWEAVDSWIFLIEYVLRLATVTESNKYGAMGCCCGRLRYALTTPALIDLAATIPYFVERSTGWNLPTLTYLRAFRLLRILKTRGFSEATKAVCRVFYYNSEILTVAAWIGVGLVLFTAVLMYYLRPRGGDADHPQFRSLGSTIYLATLMLTGQGGPDGEIPWYTSAVILLTGIFSIGMFAIPASMLTWGFEGEAERLAKHRLKEATGQLRHAPAAAEEEFGIHDDWSFSSDEYSTDEEYLKTIAGGDDAAEGEDEERLRSAFHLADVDGSRTISLSEFMKMSRDMTANAKTNAETVPNDVARSLSVRLDDLAEKVEANSQKLDRIYALLESLNSNKV